MWTLWHVLLVSVLYKGGFIIYTGGGGGAIMILTGGHDFSTVGFTGAMENSFQSRTRHKGGPSEKFLLKMLCFHHLFLRPSIVLSTNFLSYNVGYIFLELILMRMKNLFQ